MIKKASVSGMFYPDSKETLNKYFELFDDNFEPKYKSKLVIVPHAGYEYSGKLAFKGFKCLKDSPTIFIIAPSHHVMIDDFVISDYDGFETPLGIIDADKQLTDDIVTGFNCIKDNSAFEKEHATEVEIPFIQKLFPNAKIVPIITGSGKSIPNLISKYYDKASFVISSDLSHFLRYNDAQKMDNHTAEMIETLNLKGLSQEMACGYSGICGAVKFAQDNKNSLIRIGMINSGDITNDKSKVVGYGSWFLYEGSKNDYLKKYYAHLIEKICKESIASKLFNTDFMLSDKIPAVLTTQGASFVTLELNNQLRGCIGSIIAHRPLINDLISNSRNAAFNDPRFLPLSKEEFENISLSVSLLSDPEKIKFTDENDLLTKIYPNGLIIKDKNKQSVYLPVVWEQLTEPKEFLNSLKIKAGMDPNYFSDTFEAYKFKTEYITQND